MPAENPVDGERLLLMAYAKGEYERLVAKRHWDAISEERTEGRTYEPRREPRD